MILNDATVNIRPDNGTSTTGYTFGVYSDDMSQQRLQGANGLFTGDYNNSRFESGKEYFFSGVHPVFTKGDEQVMRVIWDEQGIPKMEIVSGGNNTGSSLSIIPNLAEVTGVGATTSTYSLFNGGLGLDNVPYTSDDLIPLGLHVPTKRVMTGPSLAGTGTGGGSSTFVWTPELMAEISKYVYAYTAAFIENRTGDALPPLPTGSSTVAIGKVNAVFIQLDPLLGAIPLANCSNGDNFELRIVRRDQGSWPNSFFYDAERFDGTTANGSYRVLDPYGQSRYGFLTAGLYTVQGQPKGNTSASAVVSLDFEVKAADIVPRSDYRIVGEQNPVAGAQNVQYVLQQFYSDGLWKNYSGTPAPTWVLDGAPAQVGIVGSGAYTGLFSSEASAITSDDQIIVRAFIGINIDFPITLKPATAAPTVLKPINAVFGQDVDGVGRIGLANVTEAVRARRIYEKPLGTFYGGSDWQNATIIGGAYGEAGATVQVIWPAGPTEAGTYYFKDQWESIVRITGRPYETAQLDIYSKTVTGSGTTTTPVFAYYKYVKSSNSFEIRAAPSDGPVTVTLTQYPAGYGKTGTYTMDRFDTAPLYGQTYNWLYVGYTGLLAGQYVVRFNFPGGVVKYGVMQLWGTDQEAILTASLTNTEPTVTNTGGGSGTTYGLGNLYQGVPITSGGVSQVRVQTEKLVQTGGDQLTVNIRIMATVTLQAAVQYVGQTESTRVYQDITFPNASSVPGGTGEILHIKSLAFQSGGKVRIWLKNKTTGVDLVSVDSPTVPTDGAIAYTTIYTA